MGRKERKKKYCSVVGSGISTVNRPPQTTEPPNLDPANRWRRLLRTGGFFNGNPEHRQGCNGGGRKKREDEECGLQWNGKSVTRIMIGVSRPRKDRQGSSPPRATLVGGSYRARSMTGDEK